MSIKVRLLLSYLAMLLVPVILTLCVGLLAGRYYTGDILKSLDKEYRINPLKQALEERNEKYSEIKKVALETPEKLLDEGFLIALEKELVAFNTGFILRKDSEIIYYSPTLEGFRYDEYLPNFGDYLQDRMVPFRGERMELLLNQHDFYFPDKSKGTILWAMNVNPLKSAIHKISATITAFIFIVLVMTNGTLTYMVAGSIISPLNKLKESAIKIKDGDLNFKIKAKSKDEIGEVCEAFEEMRERLQQSLTRQLQYEENRRELISNISHDLKTPITSIKGYIEGIRDGVADTPEKMEKYLNTICKKAVDVDRLIDELFLFSKLDLNRLPLNLNQLSLQHYFSDIVEELSFDLEKHGFKINLLQTQDKMNVIADGKQLKRVMVNIIENAVKYMDKEQGKIEIKLTDEGNYAGIAVKDNGMGIPKEALPYIFDRFYRTDPSRNSDTGGSGLGLAIAKKIIEEHGGTMRAESVEGEGTTIYFTLKKI